MNGGEWLNGAAKVRSQVDPGDNGHEAPLPGVKPLRPSDWQRGLGVKAGEALGEHYGMTIGIPGQGRRQKAP